MAKKGKTAEKELSVGKILLIILCVFILVPTLIFSAVYMTNDEVKLKANKVLVHIPGFAGNYFKKFPTEKEIIDQKVELARLIVDLSEERAIDKLKVIKGEDENLYNQLIKIMVKLDKNKTSSILNSLRKVSIKEDVLVRSINEIKDEEAEQYTEAAKSFDKKSPIFVRDEIYDMLNTEKNGYSKVAGILSGMKKENAAHQLRFMSPEVEAKVLSKIMSIDKKHELEFLLQDMENKELTLKNLSQIYSTESTDKLVSIIGNSSTYSMNDLSMIYKEIGIIKGASILAKAGDDSFVHELLGKIKEREILLNNQDVITQDILKAYKIYKEFEDNVTELNSVYSNMNNRQIAELLKRLLRSTNPTKTYTLNNGDVISISDEDLAFAILKKFDDRKKASILGNMDTTLSSQISKALSLPEYD